MATPSSGGGAEVGAVPAAAATTPPPAEEFFVPIAGLAASTFWALYYLADEVEPSFRLEVLSKREGWTSNQCAWMLTDHFFSVASSLRHLSTYIPIVDPRLLSWHGKKIRIGHWHPRRDHLVLAVIDVEDGSAHGLLHIERIDTALRLRIDADEIFRIEAPLPQQRWERRNPGPYVTYCVRDACESRTQENDHDYFFADLDWVHEDASMMSHFAHVTLSESRVAEFLLETKRRGYTAARHA